MEIKHNFVMEQIKLEFTADKNWTINDFLKSNGFSSSNIFHLISDKNIFVNSKLISGKNASMKKKDKITVLLNKEENNLVLNKDNISVLYEDPFMLIVDKPSGLHVQPYKINTNNNLASMVANYFNKNKIYSKVHLINRLDKLTSGIVIIAKNRYISNLFSNTKIIKKYRAIVEGKINKYGSIKVKIDKHDNENSRYISDKGKESLTFYRRIRYNKSLNESLVDVNIKTGRTHQIRLSLSSIGYPLVGDSLYGSTINKDVFLRAYCVKFKHPITHKIINIKLKAHKG